MSVTIPDPEVGSYIDPTELRIQRKNTQAFILADKKEIVLVRQSRTANATGGYTLGTPDPKPPQNMRLIPGSRQLPERELPDGTMAQPTHVLMAEWDADMLRWDTFTDDGQTYLLLYVHDKHAYQKKAEVLYRRGAT